MKPVRLRRRLTVVTVLSVVCLSVQIANAQSWREKLRDKAQETKRKWDDSARSCRECGKKIHGRDVCTTCVAKRAADRTRKATRDAKRKWDDKKQNCKYCGKTIHGRSACASCLARRAGDKVRDVSQSARKTWGDSADERDRLKRRVSEGGRAVRDGWRNSADERRQLVERLRRGADQTRSFARELHTEFRERQPEMRAAWDQATRWAQDHKHVVARHYQIARNEYGPRVMAAVRDAENQRRVLEGLGALHSAHVQFKRIRNEATYKSLKLAGQLPVQTRAGRMTLEDVARQRMVEKFPYLRGTPLTEDPAAPLAHLVTGDRKYFFDEMPLVESRGRRVSLKNAMVESSPFDTSRTMRILAVYEAADDVTHTLDTGDGAMEAIGSTLAAVDAVKNK